MTNCYPEGSTASHPMEGNSPHRINAHTFATQNATPGVPCVRMLSPTRELSTCKNWNCYRHSTAGLMAFFTSKGPPDLLIFAARKPSAKW